MNTALLNIAYVGTMVYMRPWKFHISSRVDVVTKTGLALIVLLSINLDIGEAPQGSETQIGMLVLAAVIFPLLIALWSVFYFAWFDRVNKVSSFRIRQQFAEHLSDITTIVGFRSSAEIRHFAMTLLDKDVENIT